MNESVKVMIVSSDINESAFIKMQLELAGFMVSALASNGNEAIGLAKKLQPDFIIMDIYLNDNIDGIQTAGEILQLLKTNIIFLAEFQKMDMVVKIMEMKNVRYFVKPFDIGKVKQVIEENIELCA